MILCVDNELVDARVVLDVIFLCMDASMPTSLEFVILVDVKLAEVTPWVAGLTNS